MYNTCLRMLQNEFDAEDVLQNSFVDIFRNLKKFRYESSVGAWMKRIVINNCINHLKKKRIHFDDLDNHMRHLPVEDQKEDRSYGHLDVEAVQQAVLQLPDGYRNVFTLYAMEGYDHQEIAQIMEITEATSKSQYSRAKKKLREMLNNEITMG